MNREYDETINSDEMECPYCGSKYQPESEDYDEDEREEVCDNCDKKFYAHQSFTVDHHARPDCELNGHDHDYDSVTLRNGETHPFCKTCSKCMPVLEAMEFKRKQ